MRIDHTIKSVGGVYQLTFKDSGRYYIGQSHNVLKRVLQHSGQLQRGTHSNTYIQSCWNRSQGREMYATLIDAIDDPHSRVLRESQRINDGWGDGLILNLALGVGSTALDNNPNTPLDSISDLDRLVKAKGVTHTDFEPPSREVFEDYTVNDKVEVTHGQLKGGIGIVVSIKRDNKVRLRIGTGYFTFPREILRLYAN